LRVEQLGGKVAVVTGAASGIGLALARCFGQAKMKVVLADVEEAPLAEAHATCLREGVEAIAVRTDVSRADDVAELARRTFEAYETVHVLCNNAGVGVGGAAWEVAPKDWEWILGVNLWGVVHGIRAFVPRMVEQGAGHVVNTASAAGLAGAPSMGAYSATKFAVVGLSECLHHDLSVATDGRVRVSVLCPSWVRTAIADADRNRPASLDPGPPPRRSAARNRMAHASMKSTVAAGMAPEDVADKVLRAIVEERFWILTHETTPAIVEARTRSIVEGRAPDFESIKNW
jgi:NAD(P)-dependent dehydrogenase (short-subunit alcohol dehydrogenase family)